MIDIVERLRAEATDNRRYEVSGTLATEAADRIEQLEAELTIQYQDGHHDGYEKGCTISKEASERYDRIDARIEQLEAALRELFAMCLRQTDFNDDRDGLTLDRARAALAAPSGAMDVHSIDHKDGL